MTTLVWRKYLTQQPAFLLKHDPPGILTQDTSLKHFTGKGHMMSHPPLYSKKLEMQLNDDNHAKLC